MIFSHKAHGWVDKYFECSADIQEWQSKAIYTNSVKPIKIEFDAENKVARLVK